MNTTITRAAEIAKELNQSDENSDKKGRRSTYKSKIRRALKEKMGKQNHTYTSALEVRIDSLLTKKTRSCIFVKWRSQRRN
jgi:hypothetical protein